MNSGKIVVIGGDAGGMGAASKIRREQPHRQIVVFERGYHTSYAACGIPYYIGGQVESSEHLIARKPDVFIEKQNIDVRIRHEVLEIDTDKKKVKVENLDKGITFWESWDDLLLATGASAIVPDLPGVDTRGVFALSTLQSGIEVFEYMEKFKPEKAVIVGAGYIGIEMAEALQARGMDVSVVDMADQVMNSMDKDMAIYIGEYMKGEGIHLYLEEKLNHIKSDAAGGVSTVVTDKRSLDADIVILGLGVKPNSELASNTVIQLGVGGAIRVNKRLETTLPNVWAAGDCAESFHLLKKEQVHVPLGTVANKHALVAGINISGGKAEFPGVLGTAITKFKDLEISRTGLSDKEASALGIPFHSNIIESSVFSSYYPGADKIHVKLNVEKDSGRLLGGQIVGMKTAAKRIDTIATAITTGMTAQDLANLDLSYAPPFSPVWDPVQTAARTLL